MRVMRMLPVTVTLSPFSRGGVDTTRRMGNAAERQGSNRYGERKRNEGWSESEEGKRASIGVGVENGDGGCCA